jgi:hypothetical protein
VGKRKGGKAMATAMRVAGDKEGQGRKAMAIAIWIAGN